MAARDFDAEGVLGETSVAGRETGVDERVGTRGVNDKGRISGGVTKWYS
jgi:hypothetical protein